jgi:hypothetical protein
MELKAPTGRFGPLLAWAREHLDAPLTLEDLAEQAGMSFGGRSVDCAFPVGGVARRPVNAPLHPRANNRYTGLPGRPCRNRRAGPGYRDHREQQIRD